MQDKFLFEGEEILLKSDNNLITLTNRRIRYKESTFGKAHIISITLKSVSSIEVRYKSWLIFLFLGVLCAGAGCLLGNHNIRDIALPGMLLGAAFIGLYFFTRRHLITIASNGGAKINFSTRGMKRADVLSFINRIEEAKIQLKQTV